MAAVGALVGAVLLPPAPAAAAAACDASGVTVVVDFSAFGGGVQTRCVAGDPGSGLDALGATFGFTLVNGSLFVCRIGGEPATDPCGRTPPTDAYWSYWHGVNGSWAYSTVGAAAYPVGPGMVEGWRFGAAAPPGVAVPVPVQPEPPPPPPPPPAPAPQPTRAAQPGQPPAPEPSAGTSEPAPTETASASASATPTPPTPSIVEAATAGGPPVGGRPGLGTIVGIALVAALAAVAVGVAGYRRRSANRRSDVSASTLGTPE